MPLASWSKSHNSLWKLLDEKGPENDGPNGEANRTKTNQKKEETERATPTIEAAHENHL